jgi:hypothetical protein
VNVFIIMITDGQAIEYPPEIYLDRRQAEREAEHWAWALSEPVSSKCSIRSRIDGKWGLEMSA